MKRCLLFLCVLFCGLHCVAQTDPIPLEEMHMTFKGIPINGSITSFVNKMKAQGFVLSDSDNTFALLNGPFGGNNDCQIYVSATPKSNIVYSVTVMLPESTSWASLRSDYREYKSMLVTKYGKPANTIENFQSPYYEGDGYELQAFRLDKATYGSYYKTSEGKVYISISYLLGGTRLMLMYVDTMNEAINDSEQSNIKLGDL